MDKNEILSLIPHRPPFLWIDRVVEVEPGKRCVALKYIDPDEQFFAGHFPGRSVLPGVFLIEAAAQTAAVLQAAGRAEGAAAGDHLLVAVNRFKFLKPVAPGSELTIEVRLTAASSPMACIDAVIRVSGEVVAKGELSLVVT
ncbi:MAG: 3-hydroxyacyl-ACP dehydratase FabZ [Acidobacteriota bacterium]